MRGFELVTGIGTWAALAAVFNVESPRSMVLCAMASLGCWILFLTDQQRIADEKLQAAIDRIETRLNRQAEEQVKGDV